MVLGIVTCLKFGFYGRYQETTRISCIDIRFNDFKGYPNVLVSTYHSKYSLQYLIKYQVN